MSFKKFCPKCGKETEQFVENICLDCFLKKKELFEVEKPKFFLCKYCLKLLFKNKWVDFNDESIAKEIALNVNIIKELKQPKIFIELEKKSRLDYKALIQVRGLLSKTLVEREKEINFQLRETTCDSCMKLNASYREAILQLRAKSEKDSFEMLQLTKNLLKKEMLKDSLSGTSNIIKTKNGFDLWIGSKKAASKVSRELARIYNVKIIVSKKLIGEEKSGERKYRHTFCIKIL
ncbi:MAG: 60S ribosomal export protein NMD3 [Candidatus ainarchaeum sp.]|nr:60S ribosomal export protein NMD3 [Candidatus ainarchaeum sp.]